MRWSVPNSVMRLAEVLALTGARDEALEMLSQLVKVPFGLNYGDLTFNPAWDGLREDPRFEAVVGRIRPAALGSAPVVQVRASDRVRAVRLKARALVAVPRSLRSLTGPSS